MVEKTFIKGKASCLEDSILKMQTGLKSAGFEIEERSWLNPVPNIYSVNIYDSFCPALFTNGKGASKKATLASALGEFFERLETNYFFSDFYLSNQMQKTDWLYYPNEKSFALEDYQKCLTPQLWSLYDPSQQMEAEDLLSFNDDSLQIRCLPLKEAHREEMVYFPMNLLSNLYASNGLCAGNTPLEAKVQGLSEVFERWVKAKILKENLCLPEVPESLIQTLPNIVEARQKLRDLGIEVSIRDASLGGRYPVMNVTLFDQDSGGCFASFGAHPIFEVALERTLTESLQGRSLDLLDGFQQPIFDEFLVAEDENIENHFIDSSGLIHAKFISHAYDFNFKPWDFEGDIQAQWSYLVDLVEQEGHQVYSADYAHYGVDSARVIVPGLSEIYPMDELMVSNQNQGRLLRNLLNELAKIPESERQTEDYAHTYDEVDYLGYSDHQNVANLIGLLPDDNSLWKTFKMIDLKLSLALASNQLDLAQELLHDAQFYLNNDELKKDYQALAYLMEIYLHQDPALLDDPMLVSLFGQVRLERIQNTLFNQWFLWGETLGEDLFKTSQKHQNLLKVYQQTQKAKQKYYA